LKVTTVAHTLIDWHAMKAVIPDTRFYKEAVSDLHVSDLDHLAEFAGRACYKSWSRPNLATDQNDTYLANVIRDQHVNVFEHSTVSFYVQGVSRSMLLELERHRHVSFSVESQRYVDQSKSHPVEDGPAIPPIFRDEFPDLEAMLRDRYTDSMADYEWAVDTMVAKGVDRKTARGAARAFLPESTPTDYIITANLTAWRYVIGKRWHAAADSEIREFAELVLEELRKVAPNSVQDITEEGSYDR
jgi:thymidylate synthase (FAD)